MRRPVELVVALLVMVCPAACGGDNASPTTVPKGRDDLSGDLRVFAASSLTDAFTELGATFMADHPDLKVTFSFAGSSALAQQINAGAPADVFVSADEANMAKVTGAGNTRSPKVIARNRLAILVEKGNPNGIASLADLATRDVVLVVCAPEVPCGKLAALALRKAGVDARPASLEENVKAVVSKVTLGEADAGIVFVTDVRAAGDMAAGVDIDIARDAELEAVYPIAVAKQATNALAADAWIDFVLSDEGQRALNRHGFLAP
jgi:molybdate transport system substrate-binding protein